MNLTSDQSTVTSWESLIKKNYHDNHKRVTNNIANLSLNFTTTNYLVRKWSHSFLSEVQSGTVLLYNPHIATVVILLYFPWL